MRRRRAGTWRDRTLVLALLLGVAGLQLGPSPAAAAGDYLLLTRTRLLSLPTDGDPWQYMASVAKSNWSSPELDDQDNKANVQALAAALVYARTGDGGMRAKARNAIEAMIPTYDLSLDAGLGPARQIAGWVLTADFIGLDGALDGAFRDLLRRALTQRIGGHVRWGASLRECHEDSDNNWGAWCGASRIAAARYLGDTTELQQAERVHRGFLGDRDAWSRFRGQGTSNGVLNTAIRTWSCDASPEAYVPTNLDCGDRTGAFPADAARLGAYSQLDAAYQSETTAGIVLGTELLYQAGFSGAWIAGDAIARVAGFDYKHGAWNLGSVQYHWPWLINKRLGTSYPTVPARYGRSLGYTDWLYGARGGSDEGPVDPTPAPTPTPRPSATPSPTSGATPTPTPEPGSKGKKRGRTQPSPTASGAAPGSTPAPSGAAPVSTLNTSTGATTSTIDGLPLGTASTLDGLPLGTASTLGSPGSTSADNGSTSAEAGEPPRTRVSKDGAGEKAKSRDKLREERTRAETFDVTAAAEPTSLATQLVAAFFIAGMLAVILLQSRRRRTPS